MFFKLFDIFIIFQSYINKIFIEKLNYVNIIYLDNILIYIKNFNQFYIKIIYQVLN